MQRNRFMSELDAYMRTLLWQATDEEGSPLDASHDLGDLDPSVQAQSESELIDFIGLCEREGIDVETLPMGSVGHDFMLTRNHHGAGFWDRGYGQMGEDLTKWAHTFGSADLYVGDDGRLYVM